MSYKNLILVGLLAISAFAKDKENYSTGKLLDIQQRPSASGKIQGEYCMAVQVEDVSYLVEYVPFWRSSYAPTDMIVGDSVQVRVKSGDLIFLAANGKAEKAKIVRRERIKAGAEPTTCASQVQVKN